MKTLSGYKQSAKANYKKQLQQLTASLETLHIHNVKCYVLGCEDFQIMKSAIQFRCEYLLHLRRALKWVCTDMI